MYNYRVIDMMNFIIKIKVCGEIQIFNICNCDVDRSEFEEIRILEDDFKYYINTRTGEKIAIYKGV